MQSRMQGKDISCLPGTIFFRVCTLDSPNSIIIWLKKQQFLGVVFRILSAMFKQADEENSLGNFYLLRWNDVPHTSRTFSKIAIFSQF